MKPRPALHTETLLACATAFIVLTGNGRFWHEALAGRSWGEPATWLFAGAVCVSLGLLYFALAAIFSTRHTVKPLITVALLVTAAASYFIGHYSVYLDRTMVRNIAATSYSEACELVGTGLIGHLALFGVLPCALVWCVQIKRRTWMRAAVVRIGLILGTLALSVASLLLVFADFASLMRNHREVRWLITPGNAIVALVNNAIDRGVAASGQPRIGVAPDARVVSPQRARPLLFVLVVGETARAQNFSLYGYPRQTNPELTRRGVIDFRQATSCGTATEVSLPCMFSPFGRAHYDERQIETHESVLHVLARAGVNVLWRDNQSGCKGVCDGLAIQQLDHKSVPGLCVQGHCFDEILMHGMDQVLRDRRGNLLVVMHQLGSHGPSYYKRYPSAFRRFMPQCESDDLRRCDVQAIVNAYDNTVLYTDFFLGQLVDFLAQAQTTHDTAMLYVSDHGESLGDSGLYLHGVPYAIAPHVQTHVPFVLWMSPGFRSDAGVDEACMRARAKQPVSHDNLFHTLLGVFSVRTRAYDPKLDIFAGCRTNRSN